MSWFEQWKSRFEVLFSGQDQPLLLLVVFAAVSALLILWVIAVRLHTNKRIEKLTRELSRLQTEFESVRNRSRTNLQMVRDVLDGFDGIVAKMRKSVDEEEKKLGALPAGKKETETKELLDQRRDLDEGM